jgi:hypothetical protein
MTSLSTFYECDVIEDDRPLRQGDIFSWLIPSKNPWQQYGVVVTADCDIAKEKHHEILSYVPILFATDYLRLFYLPKQLRRSLRIIKDELLARIRSAQAKTPEFTEPISEGTAITWVLRSPPEEIVDDLAITDGRERLRFHELCTLYRDTESAAAAGTFAEQLSAALLLRGRASKNHESARDKLWDEILGHVQSLPGDTLFLNTVGINNTDGYIAYLRLVREIHQSEIAIRQTDLRDSAVKARRISRLRSPYVYRLTQLLSDIFSSIGLPREYELMRDSTVVAIGNRHPVIRK